MYFEEFCQERNLAPETIRGYKSSLKKYCDYYNMTLDELIDEAIDEENDNVDKRRRSIKTRLLQFRTHLITETSLKQSSIRTKMRRIFAVYSHFDIELPKIPRVKSKDAEEIQTTYFDLIFKHS